MPPLGDLVGIAPERDCALWPAARPRRPELQSTRTRPAAVLAGARYCAGDVAGERRPAAGSPSRPAATSAKARRAAPVSGSETRLVDQRARASAAVRVVRSPTDPALLGPPGL